MPIVGRDLLLRGELTRTVVERLHVSVHVFVVEPARPSLRDVREFVEGEEEVVIVDPIECVNGKQVLLAEVVDVVVDILR